MKNTDKQKQARKSSEVRQREIIDAAMKILTTEGARQFTADRLGAMVGLASGSIFRHFGSMDDILDGIVDRIEEIIFADFPPKADNPLESLRLFFEARVNAITEHPQVSKLLQTSILIPNSNGELREKRLNEFKLRSRRFIADCLKRAKAEGLLNRDISYEESSVLVLGSIYAIGHMSIGGKYKKVDIKLIERIWNILERSIAIDNKQKEKIMGLTKILKDEHRVIEVVLDCLEKITQEANKSGKLNKEVALQAIDVIRTFADKCHHGKEENHLFARLVEKGIPKEGGPVGQMLIEHEQGRAFVKGMSDNITESATGNTEALQKFTQNTHGYVQLLRAHIQKEDGILFPMADKVLSDEDQKQLMKEFEVVESDHMGTGTHEKYIGLVVSLAKKYGVEASHISSHSCGCGH